MTGVFYSRDARLSISSSPMIVWARNLFSCILQATLSKLLWYQAIFIVGIIHSHMPILCAQSLSLPSSKFKMPILCTQSLRLPSSKFKGPILSTQSLRLPSSKSKRPILCTQSLRLPSSKFKRSILCTQSLRLPSSKFKRPKTRNGPPQKRRSCENTRSASPVFPQLGLEPNHAGLASQSLFLLEEFLQSKTQWHSKTFLSSSNYSNRVQSSLKRLPKSSK